MVLIYKNNIKDGYFKFKEKYSLKPKVLFILKWVGVLLLINVIGGIITETFLPGLGIDDNTKMIIDLFDVSFIYFIFKILIFSTIAEEALFKKAVRDVIPNNTLFIIVSSLIYSIMNIVYTEFGIISIIDDDSIIVISGLGTNTILKILTDSKNKLPKTLIIQSNNEIPKLRKEVTKLGYYIEDEKFVIDRHKDYVIIRFIRGYKKYNFTDYILGPILKENSLHVEKIINKYNEILTKCPAKYWFKRMKLKYLIYRIKKGYCGKNNR